MVSKSNFKLVIIASIFSIFCGCLTAEQANFYVSPKGNDQWSGKLPQSNEHNTDGPFASPTRALEEVRKLKADNKSSGQITINLRHGTYFLANPLAITEKDSGCPNSPVVFTSYEGERAALCGGVNIQNWQTYKGSIYKADLKNQTKVLFEQLYFKSKWQPRARVPNRSSANPFGEGLAYAAAGADANNLQILKYDPNIIKPQNWKNPQKAIVNIYCYPNYGNRRLKIEDVNLVGKSFAVAQPGLEGWTKKDDCFFVENVFEELDCAGEWYLDDVNQVLYFWPPDGKKPADGDVCVPVADNVIVIKGLQKNLVQDVRFERLDIGYCKADAIVMESAVNCSIAGCSIKNAGGNGIAMQLFCQQNKIRSNDINSTGYCGLSMMGQILANEFMKQNEIINNHINDIGKISCMQVAGIVLVAGSNNKIANNLVHDTPRWGIFLDISNDTIIEYNHVYNVNLATEDAGGINTGSFYGGLEKHTDPNKNSHVRGNIIRYNKVHDTGGYGRMIWWPKQFNIPKGQWCSPYFTFGIYLDEASCGTHVYGNIVYNVANAGICIGGGRDNIVEGNICIGAKVAQVVSVKWPKHHEMFNNRIERNIFAYDSADAYLYLHGQQAPNYPWSPADISYNHNLIWNNGREISVKVDETTGYDKVEPWQNWQKLGMDKDSIIADPMFVNPKENDYSLKPQSPAFKLGFKPIPFEKIGLYNDHPYRKN
jgi:parallel beta-helix repeat protein